MESGSYFVTLGERCQATLVENAIIMEWGENWKGAMYTTANVITYSALALTWLAAFDIAGVAWKWIAELRR